MTDEEIAAKNIESRACVACKWHRLTPLSLVHYCTNEKAIKIDPIEGAMHMKCNNMRGIGQHLIAGECGPEGRFFEPKGRE